MKEKFRKRALMDALAGQQRPSLAQEFAIGTFHGVIVFVPLILLAIFVLMVLHGR